MTKSRGVRGNPKNINIGDTFGRWTVVSDFIRKGANNDAYFLCRCECGTERRVIFRALREIQQGLRGGSCGCLQKEVMKATRKYGSEPNTPEWNRDRRLWAQYRLSSTEYAALVEMQKGLCAICLDPLTDKAHVDHRYRDRKIRGVLCHSCNVGIGHLKESKEIMLRAIEYVQD